MNLVPYVFLAWVVGGALYLVYAIKRRPHVLEGMGRAFASNATSDPAREST
jgi:hypothetical protein